MPKLSIIIPIYNAEEYLHECIDSAVEQSFKDTEIILVDDGSTDKSVEICDEYAKNDSRVKVIHQKNAGVCGARNTGINAVTTEYFTFLESDDWLTLDACERLYNSAIEHSADFVLGAYYKESTSGTSIKHPLPENEMYFDRAGIINNLIEYITGLTGERLKNPANVDSLLTDTAKLFKTDIVRKNEIYWISRKEIYSDCLEYMMRYSFYCQSAVYFDEPIYHYRRTNIGSQTAGYRKGTLDLWLIQFNNMKDFIEKNNLENLWDAYYSRICFSIIPIGGNAYRTGNKKDAMKEIKAAFSQPIYKEAFKHFNITDLPIHFRPLFYFAKWHWATAFYYMTVVMRKIMNKQRGM